MHGHGRWERQYARPRRQQGVLNGSRLSNVGGNLDSGAQEDFEPPPPVSGVPIGCDALQLGKLPSEDSLCLKLLILQS